MTPIKNVFTVLSVLILSLPAFAGGHYSCQATNAFSSTTIYVHLNLQDVMNVPGYEAFVFKHSTPIANTNEFPIANAYYWANEQTPKSFPVIAILETAKVVGDKFDGKLTVTEGRAKPYGSVYNLKCKK
jgi:hypothetical protein